jgi:hypothetical protein
VRHPVWHCTVFIQVLNSRINKPEYNVPTALIRYGDCTPSVSAQRPAPRAATRAALKRFNKLKLAALAAWDAARAITVFEGLPGLEAV